MSAAGKSENIPTPFEDVLERTVVRYQYWIKPQSPAYHHILMELITSTAKFFEPRIQRVAAWGFITKSQLKSLAILLLTYATAKIDVLHNLNEFSQRVGLRMKLDKTKVMFNEHVLPRSVSVDGTTLEVVDEYVYLGHTLQLGTHNFEREADRKIQLGNGLYNFLLVSTCSLILLAIGMDLFGFSLVVIAACDLNLTVSQKGILTSLPFIGILLVSYLWGYISDTRGRRFSLIVSVLAGFVLSSLASLSPNWIILALLKFLSVCFSCAANSATYTLVGESCIQRVRSKYTLLMTCLIILSPAAAAVLTYPTLLMTFQFYIPGLDITFRAWRLLMILLAFPYFIGGVAICFFHESPKFLANSGKNEEALEVLKSIYAINHGCSKEELGVTSVMLEDATAQKKMTLVRALYEQSAPLFRPPLLLKTLQLYYIVFVVYITNNSFLTWLPYILNLVRIAMKNNPSSSGNICTLITHRDVHANQTKITTDICIGHIEDNVIITLVASQCIFSFLNFLISYLMRWRRIVLLTILSLSTLSGLLLSIMPETISSVFLFMVFTCTCLGMGILASYFVDLYPTSCRGMVACLSIMVGRTSTFVGINVVGNLIFHHCQMTFCFWSLLVFSSVVAAWFLPPDKPKE